MADFGAKISQSGFDTKTTASKNQVFLSTGNTYKVSSLKTITVTVPAVGTETTSSTAHGLSYSPAFSAMVSGNVNTSVLNVPYSFTDIGLDLRVYSDATNITAYVRNTAATDTTMTFKIIVFENALV